MRIEDNSSRNEVISKMHTSPPIKNNLIDTEQPKEPLEQTRAFCLKDQPFDLVETPKKAVRKLDQNTPYFNERNGLEIAKLVLSGDQKPSLQKKEISVEVCSPMKQIQHAVIENPFNPPLLLTPEVTATLSPKSDSKKMYKRSVSNNPLEQQSLQIIHAGKIYQNPPTISATASHISMSSIGGDSNRPKTISDNYDLVELPTKKHNLTPRDSLLPPKPNKKKLTRKTKSSNGVAEDKISRTSNVHESSQKSWRSYTPVSLNCPNATTLKQYEISVQIGQGAYGIVKRASRRSDGTKVALKQYDKAKLCQDQNRVESLRAEITTLGLLDHPGIMKLYDAIDSGNKISIVVEYINGNNLYQYLRKLKG